MNPPFDSPALRRCWGVLWVVGLLVIEASFAQAAVIEAWVRRFDGPAGANDQARAVAVDGGGNVLVTGFSNNGEPDFYYDYYTAKYAATDGSLLWEKRYNGMGNNNDRAQALAVDGVGNAVVTGFSSNGTNDDFYTAKYAATNGVLLWEKRFNGARNLNDRAQAVAVDGRGNVVVAGYSSNGTNDDFYTAKYAAANGVLLWEKRFNGQANGNDQARAVAVDGDDNVVVTGYSSNGTNDDFYTAMYAATNGALHWEKRYSGPANGRDQANAVAVDGSGNVVVTGHSFGQNGYRYHTFKYAAADGLLLWEKRSESETDDFAEAVAVDGAGNVVVTGYSYRGPGDIDYYTIKYAMADGRLLWDRHYNGPASSLDTPTGSHSLALGVNGMTAVAGSSATLLDIGLSYDYATVVYRENLPPVSMGFVPTGVRISFYGIPGHSYTIERASTLAGPWSIIATPVSPASGLIEYIDTDPFVSSAFYRAGTP